MLLKRLVVLGKGWLLLLLFSNLALANATIVTTTNTSKEVSLFKSIHSFSKDLVQPQAALTARIAPEHTAKPLHFAYTVVHFNQSIRLVLGYKGTTTTVLQDANRCESVSCLLFPFHFLW